MSIDQEANLRRLAELLQTSSIGASVPLHPLVEALVLGEDYGHVQAEKELPNYVSGELLGHPVARLYPALHRHLLQCVVCAELHLEMLAAFDDVPITIAIPKPILDFLPPIDWRRAVAVPLRRILGRLSEPREQFAELFFAQIDQGSEVLLSRGGIASPGLTFGDSDASYSLRVLAATHMANRAIGERLSEANCLLGLGDVHLRLTQYAEARRRYEEALTVCRAIGAKLVEANCIKSLGDVHLSMAEYEEARSRYEEAHALYRAIGDRLSEANCTFMQGDVYLRLAKYEEALGRYEEAQAAYRIIGDRQGEANCIRSLGDVYYVLGEYREAGGYYEESLAAYRAIGTRFGEANCIKNLGDVHRMLAEYSEARVRYEEALPVYRAIGARLGEMNCYFGLADLDRQAQDWPAATQKYEQALIYYRQTGMVFNVALALQRLGHTARDAGENQQARFRYEEALDLLTRIASPMAREVEQDLRALVD